jgi:hypothetical protein
MGAHWVYRSNSLGLPGEAPQLQRIEEKAHDVSRGRMSQ